MIQKWWEVFWSHKWLLREILLLWKLLPTVKWYGMAPRRKAMASKMTPLERFRSKKNYSGFVCSKRESYYPKFHCWFVPIWGKNQQWFGSKSYGHKYDCWRLIWSKILLLLKLWQLKELFWISKPSKKKLWLKLWSKLKVCRGMIWCHKWLHWRIWPQLWPLFKLLPIIIPIRVWLIGSNNSFAS